MVDRHFLLLLYDDDSILVEITELVVDVGIAHGLLEAIELYQGTKHELLTLELIDLALERLSLTDLLVLELFHTRI